MTINQSKSGLRRGTEKQRWDKKVNRMEIIHHLRSKWGWTWQEIADQFDKPRQTLQRFYQQNKFILKGTR